MGFCLSKVSSRHSQSWLRRRTAVILPISDVNCYFSAVVIISRAAKRWKYGGENKRITGEMDCMYESKVRRLGSRWGWPIGKKNERTGGAQRCRSLSLVPKPQPRPSSLSSAKATNCFQCLAVTSVARTPLPMLSLRVRTLLSRERNSDRRVTEALRLQKIRIPFFSQPKGK